MEIQEYTDDNGLFKLLDYLTSSGLMSDNDAAKLTEFENLVRAEINKVRAQPELLSILETFRWNGSGFHDPWGGKLDLDKLHRKLAKAVCGANSPMKPNTLNADTKSASNNAHRQSQLRDNVMLQSYCPELLFNHCHQVFMPTNVLLPGAVMVVRLKGLNKFASDFCKGSEGEGEGEQEADDKGGFYNINHQAGLDVRACSANLNSFFGAIFEMVNQHGGDEATESSPDSPATKAPSTKTNGPAAELLKGEYFPEARRQGLLCVGATSCAWAMRESATKLRQFLGDTVSFSIGLTYGDLMLATVGGHRSKWTFLCLAECVQKLHSSLLTAADSDVLLTPVFFDLVCDWFDMSTTTLVHALGSGDRTLFDLSFCAQAPQDHLQKVIAMNIPVLAAEPTFHGSRAITWPGPEAANSRVRTTVARAFVPQPVFEAVLTGRYGSWAEFRQVCVLTARFVPLELPFQPTASAAGSTAQPHTATASSTREGHEDARPPLSGSELVILMHSLFQGAQSVVESTGGFIDRFGVTREGEPMLRALWGVPSYTYGNNGLRCVECATGIAATSPVRCMVGIATGVTYCGNLGSNFRRGYFVAGENVALSEHLTMVSDARVTLCPASYKLLPQTLRDRTVLNYPLSRVPVSYSLRDDVIEQSVALLKEAADTAQRQSAVNIAMPGAGSGRSGHSGHINPSFNHSLNSYTMSHGNSVFVPSPELQAGADLLYAEVIAQLLQALESHDQIDRQELLFELEDMEEAGLAGPKSCNSSGRNGGSGEEVAAMTQHTKGARPGGDGCWQGICRALGGRPRPSAGQAYLAAGMDTAAGSGTGTGVKTPRVATAAKCNGQQGLSRSVIDQLKRYSTATLRNVHCMLVEGNGGTAMSGVAAHFIDTARLYCSRCVFLSARAEDTTVPYAMVRKLIEELLGRENFRTEEQQKHVFKKLLQLAFGSISGYLQHSLTDDLEALGLVLGLEWLCSFEDDIAGYATSTIKPDGSVKHDSGLHSIDSFRGEGVRSGTRSKAALYGSARVASLLNTVLGMILMQKPSVVLMESAQRWDELSWKQLLLLLDLPVSLVLVLTVRITYSASMVAASQSCDDKVSTTAPPTPRGSRPKRLIPVMNILPKSPLERWRCTECIQSLLPRSNRVVDLSLSTKPRYDSDSDEDQQEYGRPMAVKLKGRPVNTVVIQYKSTQSVSSGGAHLRQATAVRSGVLHSAYAALICCPNVTRLSAMPLNKDQIRTYLQRKMAAAGKSAELSEQVVDMVFDISHGNQHWCERMVKIIVKRGAQTLMRQVMEDVGIGGHNPNGDWMDFASTTNLHSKSAYTFTLLSVFGYKHLSTVEQTVLLAASVIGEEFPLALLLAILPARVEPSSAETLAAILEALILAGFVVLLEPSPPGYAFSSYQIQRILYSLNTRVEASEYHAAIARCVENEYADCLQPHYARLSFHLGFCGAERQCDAFRYDTLVADDALGKCMFGDVTLFVRNASRHARSLEESLLLYRLVEASVIELETAWIDAGLSADLLTQQSSSSGGGGGGLCIPWLSTNDAEYELEEQVGEWGADWSVHLGYHRYLVLMREKVEKRLRDRSTGSNARTGITSGGDVASRPQMQSLWPLPYVDSLHIALPMFL